MKKILSAVTLFAFTITMTQAAPTKTAKPVIKNKSAPQSATATNPTTTLLASPQGVPPPAPATPPAPAEEPFPLKFTYIVEYEGPRLNNFDLERTQGPDALTSTYSSLDHDVRISGAVSKVNNLGIRFRANSPFDLDEKFTFKNIRFFGTWAHMIETADVDMAGKLEWEIPSTDAARQKGLLSRFNINTNWTFKTPLRNWSFSVLLQASPFFYNTPNKQSDIAFGAAPLISVDISPKVSLQAEGWLDANHANQATFFDFSQGGDDYINLGPVWNPNGNLSFNPAFHFYLARFDAVTLYLQASATF